LLVKAGELTNLGLHLLLKLPSQIVPCRLEYTLALSEYEQHRAFYVTSFPESAVGLGDDVPSGSDV